MGRVVDLARAVAAELNGHEFSMPFTAKYEPTPRLSMEKITGLEVIVVPGSCARDRESRGNWMLYPVVRIGVMRHISRANRETEVDELNSLCDEITDFLTERRPALAPWASMSRVLDLPSYIFEHIMQYSVFDGVIGIEYKAGIARGRSY